MIRLIYTLIFSVMIITSCEKPAPEPSVEPETQLTDIDMSNENDDAFYTYFRFVNETGAPMLVAFFERGYDSGECLWIDPYFDAVFGVVSWSNFVAFDEQMFWPEVLYNTDLDGKPEVRTKHEATGLLDENLWSVEQVDENSMIRTFVFTKQMYKDALKAAEEK